MAVMIPFAADIDQSLKL